LIKKEKLKQDKIKKKGGEIAGPVYECKRVTVNTTQGRHQGSNDLHEKVRVRGRIGKSKKYKSKGPQRKKIA